MTRCRPTGVSIFLVAGAILAPAAGPIPGGARAQERAATPAAKRSERKPPEPARPGGDNKQKEATIEGVDVVVDQRTGITTGHKIWYREADMTLYGDNGRYNKKTRVLEAEGNLSLDDPKHHVSANRAHVDNSETKLAIITGSVVLTLKPEVKSDAKQPITAGGNRPARAEGRRAGDADPVAAGQGDPSRKPGSRESDQENPQEARKHGGTATCDRVEDHYKRKFVVLRGNLVFTQKFVNSEGRSIERRLTAEHAEYDGKADRLVLFAPVHAVDSDGQEMHFEKDVRVGTKEGAETLSSSGRFQARIKIDEDEKEP